MKHIAFLFAVLLPAFAMAQKAPMVPAAAKQAFAKAYPKATKVKWEKEKGNFEAEFVLGSTKMACVFEANGTLIETETEIAVGDLPMPALTYLRKNYTAQPKEAEKIVKADGTVTYEAEMKGKDVIFSDRGAFLKEETDEAKDKD